VAKLATVPDDENKEKSQHNQDAVAVYEEGDHIVINSDLSFIRSFTLVSHPYGTAKWVGLDLSTNVDDITKLTLNGSKLTENDVAEAASLGLGPGHIVFWLDADQLPKTITIGGKGYKSTEIYIIIKTNYQDPPSPYHPGF